MSTKSLKESKYATKSGQKVSTPNKSNDDEILVLPPNLLEKLGINLDIIANAAGSQCKNGDEGKHLPNYDKDENKAINPGFQCDINGSSMLETASLMKNSVYLSPTFACNIVNSLPGELQISNGTTESEKTITLEDIDVITQDVEYDRVCHTVAPCSDDLESDTVHESKSVCEKTDKLEHVHATGSYKDQNICTEKFGYKKCDEEDKINPLDQINNIMTMEDNHVTDYLLGTSADISENDDDFDPKKSRNLPDKKINIISEKVITPSKYRDFDINLKNSALTAVPINTIVFNKNINSLKQIIPADSTLSHNDILYVNYEDEPKMDDTTSDSIFPYPNHIHATDTGNDDLALKECTDQNLADNKQDFEFFSIVKPSGVNVETNASIPTTGCLNSPNDFNEYNESYYKKVNPMELENSNKTESVDIASHWKKENSKIKNNKRDSECHYVETISSDCSANNENIIDSKSTIDKSNVSNDNFNPNIEITIDFDTMKNVEEINLINKMYTEEFETNNETESADLASDHIKVNSNTKNDGNYSEDHHIEALSSDCSPNTKNVTGIRTSIGERIVNNNKRNSDSKIAIDFDSKKLIEKNYRKVITTQELNISDKSNTKRKSIDKSSDLKSTANISVDKVEEIATYLMKFVNNYKKRQVETKNNNNGLKVTPKSESTCKNVIKSKLCIQGVEKPGGVSASEMAKCEVTKLKTYMRQGRIKSEKPLVVKEVIEERPLNKMMIDAYPEQDPYNANISRFYKINQFCVCKDFGRLSFYDSNSLYEHIHFWEHSTIECDSDIILSIFHDDKDCLNKTLADIEAIKEDKVVSTHNSICWHYLGGQEEEQRGFENKYASDKSTVKLSDNSQIENFKTISNVPMIETNVDNQYTPETELQKTKIDKIDIEYNVGINLENRVIAAKENFKTSSIPASIDATFIKKTNLSSPETMSNYSQMLAQTDKEKDVNLKSPTKEFDHETRRLSERNQFDNENDVEYSVRVDRKRKYDEIIDLNSGKKNVKCGACDKWLSEAEWEDHRTNEHNLIAWKEGEDFDFENVELLSSLRKLLKHVGVLKCSFCATEKRNSKNFLIHVKKCVKKDSRQNIDEQSNRVDTQASKPEKNVTCGVCKKTVEVDSWMDHIEKEHNYLAWQESETSIDLDDEYEVYQYLLNTSRQRGQLVCGKCGIVRKHAKPFMTHMRNCNNNQDAENVSVAAETNEHFEESKQPTESLVKCGVCSANVTEDDWFSHIGQQHNYLAWEDGTLELDLNDERAVQRHLNRICKDNGGLVCSKCGKRRRTVKFYQSHIQECDPSVIKSLDTSSTNLNNTIDISSLDIVESQPASMVKCGVCQMEVLASDWVMHIQTMHNYLAWLEGQTPIELDDAEFVQKYLLTIVKRIGPLTCPKCNLQRKYPKVFLHHVNSCGKADEILLEEASVSSGNDVQCGVCLAKMERKLFGNHAMAKHYNVAWIVGAEPIDLRNPLIVERYLKQYGRTRNLVCKICGEKRASCMGFYAHIIVCGKTEEEIEKFRDLCDICNNKYLCIYKSQHMKAHRDQEAAIKLKQEREAAKTKIVEVEITPGRRRAAEKAKTIIDKYTSRTSGNFACSVCRAGFDDEKELSDHECTEAIASGSGSDSDESIKLGQSSDDEDDDDDDEVDSNISAEEEESKEYEHRKPKHESSTTTTTNARLPFRVSKPQNYLMESGKEFYETHFSSEALFNEWRSCECEAIPENEICNYLPPLEESCSFKFNSNEWKVYKRFEAHVGKGACLFAGACVQCVAWAPNVEDLVGNYLAVATHRSADMLRQTYDDLVVHSSLIQIWDLGTSHLSLPKLSLGIAHEYGTVWSMSWCPSGARDSQPGPEDSNEMCRLGLLAVACSNGHAYIFSVPYPSTIPNKGNNVFFKLKPIVDLRIATSKRKIYAPTSICWAPQKGHSLIIVGYADGTTAYFDLNSSSPIVKTIENGTIILYPYVDERSQNTSITEVEMYPARGAPCSDAECNGAMCSGAMCRGATCSGAVCSGSSSGAGVQLGRRVLHIVTPATRVCFAPLWPSLLLAGDNGIVSQPTNEVELSGDGHRRGVTRSWAGCSRCGRVVAFQPPSLRAATLHPADSDVTFKRQVIGSLFMVSKSLGRKRKLKDDELTVVLEPVTYEDAIKKYGLEWKEGSKERSLSPLRSRQPVRYPLGDAPSMAFYPSPRHHSRLAVATHAGFVLLLNIT